MKKFFLKYHYFLLIIIISFSFFSRILRINIPERYIFDEVYHALTSKLIARDDVRAYEWWNQPVEKDTAVDWLHPPYAKYSQAFFIRMLGENSFGWRISSVIFGVLVIVMVYKLSFELFENKNLSLLATLLASLDGLLLVLSRIAMNDIHVTFFILLTFFFYVRYKKLKKTGLLILTGISAGMAMGTKWSGLFALLTVGFFEAIAYLQLIFKRIKVVKVKENVFNIFKLFNVKRFLLLFFTLIILPLSMYLLSYSHMFIQGKSLICLKQESIRGECYFERIQLGEWKWEGYLSHFAELHRQIWWYQTNLNATHTYQSRPYQWFLNLRPVWIHVNYQEDKLANIYAQGNSTLFWVGDITIGITLLIYLFISTAKALLFLSDKIKLIKILKKNDLVNKLAKIELPKYLWFLTFAYFAVWLPWQLSPRIMFFYHYTPAVPLLAIILAYWLNRVASLKVKKFSLGKVIVTTVVILCGVNFIVFYPNWTAIPVSKNLANQIYFAIKSWK